MRPIVARAPVPARSSTQRSSRTGRASPLLWARAVGLPALGTLLGGIAAFMTLSIADHMYVTICVAAIAALLFAGALRVTVVRLARDRAMRRLAEASTIVDSTQALDLEREGARVRLRGIVRAAGHAHHGWLFRTASIGDAGLFDTALDFWLVDEHGGRAYVEIANAYLVGAGGLRDGDEVEVSGALARRPNLLIDFAHGQAPASAYRDVPLRPILRADRAPLVVVPRPRPPGVRGAHAL